MRTESKANWSKEKKDTFLALKKSGATSAEIATALGMKRRAVNRASNRLGLTKENIWKDEARVEKLKALFHAGLSITLIAKDLDVNRGVVSGKLDRLGLTRTCGTLVAVISKASPRTKKQQSEVKTKSHLKRTKTVLEKTFEYAKDPVQAATAIVVPISQRRFLVDLTEETCRWPVDVMDESSDTFFCGGQCAKGLPYCGSHASIAYRPSSRAA